MAYDSSNTANLRTAPAGTAGTAAWSLVVDVACGTDLGAVNTNRTAKPRELKRNKTEALMT